MHMAAGTTGSKSVVNSTTIMMCLFCSAVWLQEIDTCIDKASDHGYSAFLAFGSRALNLATNIILASAIKVRLDLVNSSRWRRHHHCNNTAHSCSSDWRIITAAVLLEQLDTLNSRRRRTTPN